jgi:hypothetical protein
MVVRQQALGHRHGQEREAGGLDERPDLLVRLRIGGTLAQYHQRPLRVGEQVDRAVDRLRCRQLTRRVEDPPQRRVRRCGIDDFSEHRGWDVEIDSAGATRHRGPDRSGDAEADVFDPVHLIGGLGERFRRR